ncbi:MAG: hypothetical protein ABIN97_20780 [Ginsengibacter sp.]
MKKISLWAKQNKTSARFLVVFIKIALAFMACYTGNKLYQIHVSMPIVLVGVSAVVSLIAAILYPSKKLNQLSKHQLYVRQKSCDFILSACTFIIILTIVNNQDTIKPSLSSAGFASIIKKHPAKAEEILASLSYRDKSSLTRMEKRILKKEFVKQLKIYAIAKVNADKENANNSLAIILTIIVAIGLLGLLAAIVCNLSCSGADVAAGIVGILGLVAIIWGSVLVINHINRKSKK